MMIFFLCILTSFLPAAHGLEFGRHSFESPIFKRKRVLGMEYVQNGWTEPQKLDGKRILDE